MRDIERSALIVRIGSLVRLVDTSSILGKWRYGVKMKLLLLLQIFLLASAQAEWAPWEHTESKSESGWTQVFVKEEMVFPKSQARVWYFIIVTEKQWVDLPPEDRAEWMNTRDEAWEERGVRF